VPACPTAPAPAPACCAAVAGAQFSPTGPCPLAAAGLLLPADWCNAAVAEGKLLSGGGDTAAWSRWGLFVCVVLYAVRLSVPCYVQQRLRGRCLVVVVNLLPGPGRDYGVCGCTGSVLVLFNI
jgi:hypothetical protein